MKLQGPHAGTPFKKKKSQKKNEIPDNNNAHNNIYSVLCADDVMPYFWLSRLFILSRDLQRYAGGIGLPLTVWICFRTWLMTFECKFLFPERTLHRNDITSVIVGDVNRLWIYVWQTNTWDTQGRCDMRVAIK